ncbi:MAG TPA: TolC family protein [Acetobacteraceae bacterium]|nr:TolC family protein [Acetobacteraceae bacterium]
MADVGALRHDGVPIGPPLTVDAVARLALENNPDLLATRSQHGIAQAQLLEAGLLPNPQVTGALLPLAAGVGTTNAWNAGISEDIRSLITLSARRTGAQAAAQQVDAQILWQEWQTIGQARLLAVDLIQGQQMLRLLTQVRDLLANRNLRSQAALARGNATIATIAPDLAALQAAQTQLDDAERLQLSRRHQLNALLGLSPDFVLPLAGSADVPPVDPTVVERQLPSLARRRPDLVALQLGYRAQDAKVRAAILAQFPNLTFGVTGASDNSNVRNVGPQITLDLPVFDRNQGNIAIERATRRQLHDEYTARLTAAEGQVRAMLSEMAQLRQQRHLVLADLSRTNRMAAQGQAALLSGNLDERNYVDLVSARLAREQEIVSLEQSLLEQRVAIATLIGSGMPPIIIPKEEANS